MNRNSNFSMGTILVVEDDDDTAKGLRLALVSLGYEVIIATDGASALQLLENRVVDLVLLDIGLPACNGFFVLERMSKQNITSPVIVVSARDTSTDEKLAKELGALAYMKKPVNLKELLSLIHKTIEHRCNATRQSS